MGYGYENEEEDYGYGDTSPDQDYGYGDANTGEEDYGYGDAAPCDEYGYGDCAPSEPQAAAGPSVTRPKRRCSVTKFNLDNENVLTAADRIKELRDDPVVPDTTGYQTDEKSSEAGSTQEASPPAVSKPEVIKKKGVMSRMRKRLSLAF